MAKEKESLLAPDREDWSRLYQAAIQIKEMAPWEWMSETNVFGVENPETGELGFVSVMGALGEHISIAVYLGRDGLYRFWAFGESDTHASITNLLEMPHLQASFEDRKELTKQDRDVIKKLGLKFRGRQAWPMFRSYRPGYMPWYIEASEARFLAHALEQILDVAPRFKEHPELLSSADEEDYLVRVARSKEGEESQDKSLVWEDQIRSVPPPEDVAISVPMDVEALDALKRMPLSEMNVEVDFFIIPAGIGSRDERPRYAYSLLMVASQMGFVLGHEILESKATLEETYGVVPMVVVQLLANAGMKPSKIRVRSEWLFQLLYPLVEELGLELNQVRELPALDEVQELLIQELT